MECDICGKGLYYFQPQMSVNDEVVGEVIWHKQCASSFEEWEEKILKKLSEP